MGLATSFSGVSTELYMTWQLTEQLLGHPHLLPHYLVEFLDHVQVRVLFLVARLLPLGLAIVCGILLLV